MSRDQEKSPEAMRSLLWSLVGGENEWTLIGRALYWRGRYGMFKLEIDSCGQSGYFGGLVGTFTPNSGGRADRIEFKFPDHLVGTNPTKNPNFREPYYCGISYDNLGWTWSTIVPASLQPLHTVINEWVLLWDLTSADLDKMVAEANRPTKRGKRSA